MSRPYLELKIVKVKKEKCKHSEILFKNGIFKCEHCGHRLKIKRYDKNTRWGWIEYNQKQLKGNWVNNENLDKIKFPCFCSYCNGYGLITRTKANEYYNTVFYTLHGINKQHSSFCSVRSYTNFRDLITVWDIHILKGKIILFEEE